MFKKKLPLLIVLFFFPNFLFSQNLKKTTVPIEYGVWLSKTIKQNLGYEDLALTANQSSQNVSDKILTAFFSKIEKEKQLFNINKDNEGSSAGDFSPFQAVFSLENKDSEIQSKKYFRAVLKNSYDTLNQTNDTLILLNREPYILNKEIILVEEKLPVFIYRNIGKIDFFEEWEFNSRKGKFFKHIKNISLNICYKSENEWSQKQILNLETGAKRKRRPKEKWLVSENIIYDVRFDEVQEFTFSDFYTFAITENYIEASQRYKLLFLIFKAISDEKCKVYKEKPTEEKQKQLDIQDIEDFFRPINLETEEIENRYSMADIVGFRFYEDWFFDSEYFVFYKKINALSLIFLKEFSQDKEKEKTETQFYIEF